MSKGMEGVKGVAYSWRDKSWLLLGGKRWLAHVVKKTGEAGRRTRGLERHPVVPWEP